MQQYLQNEKGLVQNVFDKVFDKYDLMNDFMSFGIHRLWKKDLIHWMNPGKNKTLLDVACGTGDLAKLFQDKSNNMNFTICVDPNEGMISKGKEKLKKYSNIKWIIGSAENLPVKDESCDYYSISFGLRNTKNIDKSLSEAYRVLKPGGRIMVLEFSQIPVPLGQWFYDRYSFNLIPKMGELIANDRSSYQYLVESIRKFPDQETFLGMVEATGFENAKYRNLSLGIACLHSGWKI